MANLEIPIKIDAEFLIKVVRGVTASPEFNETTSDDYKKGFFDFADALINTLEKISKSGTEEKARCGSCRGMTPQEAIEWLKAIEKKYIHGGDECFDEKRKVAINNAVNALEKQTPKKAIKSREQPIRYATFYNCPKCMGQLTFACNNYCHRCGQALDWSDAE